MCASISPGHAAPPSRKTSAPLPATERASDPTPMILPSTLAATSGSQPANRMACVIEGPFEVAGLARSSQAVGLGDDLLHDLVRAGADPRQPGVAPGPFDRELAHVTVPAQDLNRLVGDVACDLRREQLGLGDLSHRVLSPVPLLRSLVDEGLDRGDLRAHVDQLVLDDLEL